MNPLSKEEFLEKLKTNRDFNNRYGRKHITEGKMVLPPCHYGFQVYTRELSEYERMEIYFKQHPDWAMVGTHDFFDKHNIPKRAISLMWNQRSCDTFLGIPFNIASYALLLEIIAKEVNMVPDELIGNLGDVHLYSNHIEQAKEQIGRKYTEEERLELLKTAMGDYYQTAFDEQVPFSGGLSEYYESYNIPLMSREPYKLPTLKIENGVEWREGDCLPYYSVTDFKLDNYQSHPVIKAPLSN